MPIPHAGRDLVHSERTIVPSPPADALDALRRLDELVAGHDRVRVDGHPARALRPGDTFCVGHGLGSGSGHAVGYEVVAVTEPNLLALRSRSDRSTATHRVLVAPAVGGGAEVVWTVSFGPDRAVSRQVVAASAELGVAALRRLTDRDTPAVAA